MTIHAKTDLLPVHVHDADEAAAATYQGAEVDTLGCSHVLFLLTVGAAVGTLNAALEEADVGGAFAAALDDDGNAIAFDEVSSSNDQTTYAGLVRTDRRKRRLKLPAVVATNAVNFSAVAIKLNLDHTERATAGYSLAFEV